MASVSAEGIYLIGILENTVLLSWVCQCTWLLLDFSSSFITLTANRRGQGLIDIQTTAEAENGGA